MLAYPGLQVGSVQGIARIKNLTTQAGKGLTDALLRSLFFKFPIGKTPDAIFITRRVWSN